MKNIVFVFALILLASQSAAQTVSSFTLHGEYDLHTNSPTITIYHPDNGPIVDVGTNWLESREVTNGVIWQVNYPSSDCQSNATFGATEPVILTGVYTCISTNGTNNIDMWFRLPVGFSGSTYAFFINPSEEYSLSWQCLENVRCNPGPQPLAAISVWGNIGSDSIFYGADYLELQKVAGLAIGSAFGFVLNTNGSLTGFPMTTNWNTDFQLALPRSVSNNVRQIACGDRHSLALLDGGTVVAWGENRSGQTDVPTNLVGVAAIACGSVHSLALTTNGTVAAWGSDIYGETDVPSWLSNVVQIAGGDYFSAALRNDGTVIAWGDDAYGATDVPSGLENVVRITCGTRHISALKSDGSVSAWGGRFSSPSLTNVVYMASGEDGDWYITGDGSVTLEGPDNEVAMPWSVSNVVMLAVHRNSHAIVSGPVILDILSAGGTNANVVLPAAVAGRLEEKSALTNSWAFATNTVKYVGDQKHINVSGDSFNQFFRLGTNSEAISLGLGPDALFATTREGGESSTNRPPPPGESMSMMIEEPVQEMNPMELFLQMLPELEALRTLQDEAKKPKKHH